MQKNKTILLFVLIAANIIVGLPAIVLAADFGCCFIASPFTCSDTLEPACDVLKGAWASGKKCNSTTQLCDVSAAATVAPTEAPTKATDVTKVLINPIGGTNTNVTGITDPTVIIGTVIKTALGIVGSIALLMFIYGGFLWLTSMGNEKKITEGKNVIVWAVIGLIIIFLSYTLVGFVIKAITGGAAAK